MTMIVKQSIAAMLMWTFITGGTLVHALLMVGPPMAVASVFDVYGITYKWLFLIVPAWMVFLTFLIYLFADLLNKIGVCAAIEKFFRRILKGADPLDDAAMGGTMGVFLLIIAVVSIVRW